MFAGVAAGVVRSVLPSAVRVLSWLFQNPVKWFRPSHAGFGILDALRARYTKAQTVRDLTNELKLRPLPGVLTVLPALCCNCATGVIMFSTYEYTRYFLHGNLGPYHYSGLNPVVAGGVSGAVTSAITIPMEAVKESARVVRESSAGKCGHKLRERQWTFHLVKELVKFTRFEELRGRLLKTLFAREVVTTAAFFGTYESVRSQLLQRQIESRFNEITQSHVLPTVTAAYTASLVTGMALLPFDAAKQHFFDLASQTRGGGVHVPTFKQNWIEVMGLGFRRMFANPSPIATFYSLTRTVPSIAGLIVFEVARAYDQKIPESVQN